MRFALKSSPWELYHSICISNISIANVAFSELQRGLCDARGSPKHILHELAAFESQRCYSFRVLVSRGLCFRKHLPVEILDRVDFMQISFDFVH